MSTPLPPGTGPVVVCSSHVKSSTTTRRFKTLFCMASHCRCLHCIGNCYFLGHCIVFWAASVLQSWSSVLQPGRVRSSVIVVRLTNLPLLPPSHHPRNHFLPRFSTASVQIYICVEKKEYSHWLHLLRFFLSVSHLPSQFAQLAVASSFTWFFLFNVSLCASSDF